MFKKIYQNLKVARDLSLEGKLHKKLLIRLYMMFIMVFFAFGVVIYDIAIYRINFFVSIFIIFITFILGYFMSKTSKISWDEEQELMVAGKMDLTSGIVLIIYVATRLISRYLLDNIYHDAVVVFAITMSIMAGFALGKFLGFVSLVRKTYALK